MYKLIARSALNFRAIRKSKAVEVPTGLKPFFERTLLTSRRKIATACERRQEKQVIFGQNEILRKDYNVLACMTYLLLLVRLDDHSSFRHLSVFGRKTPLTEMFKVEKCHRLPKSNTRAGESKKMLAKI